MVVVVAASVGTYFLYRQNHPPLPAGPREVAVGDNVTVNYIGFFGSGPEQGRVFDTSLKAVANNNVTYPKTVEYVARNSSSYTPLGVHVGAKTPGSGYNVGNITYGGVVTGFWQGLLGLSVNQTRLLTIPPYLAYGPANPSCVRFVPLVQNLSSTVVLTPAQFAKGYPGVDAFAGTYFVDPTYGWSDTVLSSNNTTVVVGYLPTVGTNSSYPGWPVRVTAVSASTITLENLLTSADVGAVGGKLANASVCNSNQFFVSALNPNGTFTEDFNREVAGQTLEFYVTVVAFAPVV